MSVDELHPHRRELPVLFSLSKLLYICTVILIMYFVVITLLNLGYNPVFCCDKPLCGLFLLSATSTAVAQFSACERTFIMSSVALNGASLHRKNPDYVIRLP